MRVGLHAGLLLLGVAAVLTATPGFERHANTGERTDTRAMSARAPKRVSDDRASRGNAGAPLLRESQLDGLLEAFNADLGDDGVPIERQELEEALRTDPELRDALLE
ncbi:MAG: hypothetical protein ACT4O5_11935 [Gammaproteobacteria bacterium]